MTGTLWRLVGYLGRYRGRVGLELLALLGYTAFGLIVPQLIKWVIDVGLSSGDARTLIPIALGILLTGVLLGAMAYIQRYFAEWLGANVAADLRNELYDHIQRLPFAYHDAVQTGQLISRIIEDVSAVQQFVGLGVFDFISFAMLSMGVLAVMILTNPLLAAITMFPLVLLAFITIRFGSVLEELFRDAQASLAQVNAVMQEALNAVQLVKAYAREEYEKAKFRGHNRDFINKRIRVSDQSAFNWPVYMVVVSLSTVLLLLVGGQIVINQAGRSNPALTIGDLVAFNTYVGLLQIPTQRLGDIVNTLTWGAAAGARVFEILDTEADIKNRPGAKEVTSLRGRVVFDHVSFKYGGAEIGNPYTLRDVNLVAEPNQIIALVGPTGSGKSSLVNLVARFYEVTEGRLTIDDVPVDQWELKSLRRAIGIVAQEPLLFQDTIRNNIAYGRPDATDEEVIAAAKAAQAHDFIMSFPDGYDTEVGVRGTTVSGGQRQRIAIARALLLNPRILILDDSTSSVDMRTEYLIQKAMAKLMTGRTTFVIAQRLSTVKRADEVIVLDRGQIVERGTHQELLARDGLYARIYAVQMADRDRLTRELSFLDMVKPEAEERGDGKVATVLVNGQVHDPNTRSMAPAERRTVP